MNRKRGITFPQMRFFPRFLVFHGEEASPTGRLSSVLVIFPSSGKQYLLHFEEFMNSDSLEIILSRKATVPCFSFWTRMLLSWRRASLSVRASLTFPAHFLSGHAWGRFVGPFF